MEPAQLFFLQFNLQAHRADQEDEEAIGEGVKGIFDARRLKKVVKVREVWTKIFREAKVGCWSVVP